MSIVIDLKGHKALVTGAGRGIGRAIALSLAEAGADLALCARTQKQLDQVAAEARGLGVRAEPTAADLRERDAADRVVAAAIDAIGGLSILVHAAGVERHQATIETTDEDYDAVMDTNLGSTFRVCRAAGARMIGRGGGRILLVASVGAFVAMSRNAPYHASKAGMVLMAKSLALEWAGHNITVNAICPGYVRTEMLDSLLETEERKTKFAKAIPLHRFAEPAEIGRLAAFMVSDAASYITGASLIVDGGLSAT